MSHGCRYKKSTARCAGSGRRSAPEDYNGNEEKCDRGRSKFDAPPAWFVTFSDNPKHAGQLFFPSIPFRASPFTFRRRSGLFFLYTGNQISLDLIEIPKAFFSVFFSF